MRTDNEIYYSSEHAMYVEKAREVLLIMKELEEKYEKERNKIIEKTSCGIRIKYVKKNQDGIDQNK